MEKILAHRSQKPLKWAVSCPFLVAISASKQGIQGIPDNRKNSR